VKLFLRIVAVVAGIFLALGVLQMVASESGEVVVLTTTDGSGAEQTTRLWVVDHEGAAWLRAGQDGQGWYGRLQARAAVTLERDGVETPYNATPVPAATAEINRLMAEKYGWADRLIGFIFPRDSAVAIRLDP
jgi:hypothetical protein